VAGTQQNGQRPLTPANGKADQPTGSWGEVFSGRLGLYTFVLNLGMMLYAINQFVVATIMPTVVTDLGGVDYYTWAFSLFAVGAIIGSASAGPVRNAIGVRRSYAGAGLVLGIGLAGAALASDMPTLVGFRLIQGIGGGAVASQAYGLVAVIFPVHLRGRVLTVVSTIWGVATVGGPGFGAIFAESGLWRGAFWSLVPLTLIFALLAWRYIESGRGHGRLSDIPYWRLALLGLAILLLSATSLGIAPWLRGGLIVASAALVALAFWRDARAEHTMFPRRATALFTELGAAYWIIMLISIVLAFVNTYTTYYLQVLHGVPPFAAGYLFAIQSLMWTVGALMVAGLRGPWETASIVAGLFLILLSSITVALTVESGPVAVIAVALAVNGMAIGFINNPAIQRAIAAAPEAEKHVAGTSVQTIRNIGISFGAALSGMVAASSGLSDEAGRAAVAGAMSWVYGVNVLFAMLALIMAVPLIASRRGRRPRPEG